MDYPGFVVNPDGSRVFVDNKQLYFQQHPEAYKSNQDALKYFVHYKNRCAANQASKNQDAKAQKAASEADAETSVGADGQCIDPQCIKGRVPKTCDVCRGSFARLGVTGMPTSCKNCEGHKFVYGTCPTCSEGDRGMVNALR